MARPGQNRFDDENGRYGDQEEQQSWQQGSQREQSGGRSYGMGGAYGSSGGQGSQGGYGGSGPRGRDDMWGQSGDARRGGQRFGGDIGGEESGYGRQSGGSSSDWGRQQGSSYGSRSDWSGQGRDRGFLERAGDEVSSWFGDREAERRREADHRGKGPRGYTRSDDRIRDDVNDRLSDDPRVDASEIEVTVENGEVTLSGSVESRQAKRQAEDCVEDVTGVKHVQNNLRVNSSSSSQFGSYAESGSETEGARSGILGAAASKGSSDI